MAILSNSKGAGLTEIMYTLCTVGTESGSNADDKIDADTTAASYASR